MKTNTKLLMSAGPTFTCQPWSTCCQRLRHRLCVVRLLPLLLWAVPDAVEAQYSYTTTTNGAVTIPSTINGLPGTSFGDHAFEGTGLMSVRAPNSEIAIAPAKTPIPWWQLGDDPANKPVTIPATNSPQFFRLCRPWRTLPVDTNLSRQSQRWPAVFRFNPNPSTQEITPVATNFNAAMNYPNGLCFSPDESKLYVAESWQRNILVCDVETDGILTNSRVFAAKVKTGWPWSSAHFRAALGALASLPAS